MSKRKGPTASELIKMGNVRVPGDWQPFGGFSEYDEYDEDDDSDELESYDENVPRYKRTFHVEIVSLDRLRNTSTCFFAL